MKHKIVVPGSGLEPIPLEVIIKAYQRIGQILFAIDFAEQILPEFEDHWDAVIDSNGVYYDLNVSIADDYYLDERYDDEPQRDAIITCSLYRCTFDESSGYWQTQTDQYVNLCKFNLRVVE